MIFNKLFLSKTKRAAVLYPMEMLSGNASFVSSRHLEKEKSALSVENFLFKV